MKLREIGSTLATFGLFMLGAAALIFSGIALHFYTTEVIPHIREETGIVIYCQSYKSGDAVVTVSNQGEGAIKEVLIYLDGKFVCKLEEIPPKSSDVCKATVKENTTVVFRTILILDNGKKLKYGGICSSYIVEGVD